MIDTQMISKNNLDQLKVLYAFQLMRFVKFHRGGQASTNMNLSREDILQLQESGDAMIVAYRNRDLPRFRTIIERLSKASFTVDVEEKIAWHVSNFQEVLENIDVADYDDSWNFFAAGLDVLLDRVETALQKERIKYSINIGQGTLLRLKEIPHLSSIPKAA